MQKVLYLTIFLFCNSLVFGQTTEQKIKSISKAVEKINKDTGECTTKIHPLPYVGELKGFYKSGQLKKIFYKTYYPQGYCVSEYYFLDNKLIFIYEKEDYYITEKGGSEKPTPTHLLFSHVKNVYEARYYFSEDELSETNILDMRKYVTRVFISNNNNREKSAFDSAKDLIEQLSGTR